MKSKNFVCVSLLISTLIIPTTSYASNNQTTNDSKNIQSVFHKFLSFFQNKNQVEVTEVSLNNDFFYLGEKKLSSKEIEKYNNKYGDHDRDNGRHRRGDDDGCRDPFDSAGIWRDWYSYGDWDWDWWKKP